MNVLAVIFVVLIQCGFLFGQDGSDMNYIKPEELNKSFVRRKLHLDFYNVTRGLLGQQTRIGDKITLEINGKKVVFAEKRIDDGLNNWFFEQYLESIDKVDGLKLRIKEFELLKINKHNLLVKGFFVFVDNKGKTLEKKSFTKELSFPKKDIVEYLFKAKD